MAVNKQPVLKFLISTILVLTIAGCSTGGDLIEKFTGSNDKKALPGKREAVLNRAIDDQTSGGIATEPVVAPVAINNANWSQPGGSASNTMQNLSLARQLSRAFAVDAGKGSDSDGRLTASPIVVGGRVYVMDSQASVYAFSAGNGARAWAVSLVPKGKDGEGAFGGGIASDGRNIYATTAFGEVVALSTANGAEVWRRKFDAPILSAPTVSNGAIFFTTVANEVNAISTGSGDGLWRVEGTGEQASAAASTSPAVSGGIVVIPHTTGDLAAFSTRSGSPAWVESLTSRSSGNALGNLNDIAGRPAIAGGSVYAIGHSGRFASLSLNSGLENWSRELSGTQTPWVAGEYVFVISGKNRMAAVSRRSGKIKWIIKMPGGGIWSGPVMGGGRLLAASSDGRLASISAQTGQLINTIDAGGKFYIAPIIAGNKIFLLDDSAKLIALR